MRHILNLATHNGRFNILTCATHEAYQSNLSDVNADFYMFQSEGIKTWETKYRPMPNNHFLLPKDYIPRGINFDFVLNQNKLCQYQKLAPIAQQLQIPLISLEHCVPQPGWSSELTKKIEQMPSAVSCYISEYSAKKWMSEKYFVIPHCIDTDVFTLDNNQIRNNHILTVANDYINRDYVLNFQQYIRVTQGLSTFPVGETPGFSKAASSVEELVHFYQTSRIFLNTAHFSPIPMSLLEAMACLPEGEFVFFDYQCEKIEDIVNIITFDQKTKNDKILKKHKLHYNDDLYSIKCAYIPKFRLTKEHPVAIVTVEEKFDGSLKKRHKRPYKKTISEIQFKKTCELNVGDYVVIPKPKKNIEEINMSDEWLRFYGLFLAEGHTHKGNITFTFHKEETEYIDFIVKFAKSNLDRSVIVEPLKDEKAVRCIFTHAALARKINNYLNGLSHEKRIPNEFMQMNERQTRIFVEAYLDGDGYRVLGRNSRSYSTTSPFLARQMFYLLMKLGYLPCFSEGTKGKRGKIRGREFIGKPIHQISFTPKTEVNYKKQYLEDENNFYVKIKDIQRTHYIGTVYNLSTESNTFTNPFALTHNCGTAVVSINSCAIPEYVTHGENGFLAETDEEMRHYLELLLKDEELATNFGLNAAETIKQRCSKERFTTNWNNLFEGLHQSQTIYRR